VVAMVYIPDNYDRFEMHMAEQERELDKLPECSECGEKIQVEYCFEVNGEYICEGCMKENHRKSVDMLI
jgi:formylmethanofuran dehydrogenase subunit E